MDDDVRALDYVRDKISRAILEAVREASTNYMSIEINVGKATLLFLQELKEIWKKRENPASLSELARVHAELLEQPLLEPPPPVILEDDVERAAWARAYAAAGPMMNQPAAGDRCVREMRARRTLQTATHAELDEYAKRTPMGG
jgi:hypothetical protein